MKSRPLLPRARQSITMSFSLGGAEDDMASGAHEKGELSEIFLKLGRRWTSSTTDLPASVRVCGGLGVGRRHYQLSPALVARAYGITASSGEAETLAVLLGPHEAVSAAASPSLLEQLPEDTPLPPAGHSVSRVLGLTESSVSTLVGSAHNSHLIVEVPAYSHLAEQQALLVVRSRPRRRAWHRQRQHVHGVVAEPHGPHFHGSGRRVTNRYVAERVVDVDAFG